MLDLSRIREEIAIRQALRKKDPKLVLLIDEQSRRLGANYLALLIENGTVRLNADGSLRIAAGKMKQAASIRRTAPPVSRPVPPSDYGKLLEANRQRTWTMPPESFHVQCDLLRYVERNNKAQTALHAATLAAQALNIPTPNVRVWRGDERQADRKAGWVCSSNVGEINVILAQSCQEIIATCVHETKHVDQFLKFPNLSAEQRESDAAEFEKDFALYVLHEVPAAWVEA